MSAFSEFQVRFGKLKPIQWMSKSIRNKLLVAMMSAAMIPLIAVAVAINSAASESLLTQTFDRLTAVRTIKATQVGDYLNTIKAQAATFAEYARQLLDRLIGFGVPVASLAGGFFVLKSPVPPGALALDGSTDSRSVEARQLESGTVKTVLWCGAALVAFVMLHFEANRAAMNFYPEFRFPALTIA